MAADLEMNEIHWLMDMFNTVDVGLVVLDRNYNVCVEWLYGKPFWAITKCCKRQRPI